MFKLYLPHVEDQERTIQDDLQNQGNWYGKHTNDLHYNYATLTALTLMQLEGGSTECKNKQKSIWKTQFLEEKKINYFETN